MQAKRRTDALAGADDEIISQQQMFEMSKQARMGDLCQESTWMPNTVHKESDWFAVDDLDVSRGHPMENILV